MFGTLYCNSKDKEAKFVERSFESNVEKNSACDRCRAKKVRCSAHEENCCSRCKLLGKLCTFRSSKRKAAQITRKASINAAQQNCSPDLLGFSSASSSSENVGHEEANCPEKHAIEFSSHADDEIDDNERGQELFADPAINRLADISLDFDQVFPAELDQQSSSHSGDDVFNFSPSPLSYFPTVWPNELPESFQAAPHEAPENLPSMLPGLGNEIPFQYQDWSLLEYPFQNPSDQLCQCLAAVIFAVEEFEANCNSGDRAELDSIVANLKGAVGSCKLMLKCSNCMSKRENFVLLVFMAEKLVTACGRIVVLYRMRDARVDSRPSSMLGLLPTNTLSQTASHEGQDLVTCASTFSPMSDDPYPCSLVSTCTDAPRDWQEILIGDYEISSSLEWEHLVRVLISLQLRAVMELFSDMKMKGSRFLGEAQSATLARAELRVGELEQDMQSL